MGRSRFASCSAASLATCQQAVQTSGLYFTDTDMDKRWTKDSSSASVNDGLDDNRSGCLAAALRVHNESTGAASGLENAVPETVLELIAGAEKVAKCAALEHDLEMIMKLPALKMRNTIVI